MFACGAMLRELRRAGSRCCAQCERIERCAVVSGSLLSQPCVSLMQPPTTFGVRDPVLPSGPLRRHQRNGAQGSEHLS